MYFTYPQFDSAVAPELNGHRIIYPVVIVGAGPVGLAIALSLANVGVASIVLEAENTIGIGSRAGSLSRQSVEFLASLGIGAALLETGLTYASGWTYYRDREVFRLSIPGSLKDQFPPMLKIQQCLVESFLCEKAIGNPLIDIRWGSSLENLVIGTDKVTASVRSEAGTYDIEAEYLVGADGAHSTVRRLLGLTLEGKTYDTTFIIADVKLGVDFPPGRRMWFDPPWNPGGTVIMHLQPYNIWRFDYSLPVGSSIESETKRVGERLDAHLDWLGWNTAWELDWTTEYKAHLRIVDKMRSGRILLAGDAAHLIPIFGVRGLNGGLSDAANLSWKLARVIRGKSKDHLLDTYDEEQHLVFSGNAANADLSTQFISPSSSMARLLRDAVLQLAEKYATFRPLIDPRQSQPIPLYSSSLISAATSSYHHRIQAGLLIPNLLLDDSGEKTFLNDLLGKGFTLLRLAQNDKFQINTFSRNIGNEDILQIDVLAPIERLIDISRLWNMNILIRPDRYVSAIWPDGSATRIEMELRASTGSIPNA